MVYVYIKGSTNKQNVEQKRSEINSYIKTNKLVVNEWIEESIIGLFCHKQSNLQRFVKKTRKRDFVICSELTSLGNNFLRLYTTLLYLLIHGVQVYSVREKYLVRPNWTDGLLTFTHCIRSIIQKSKKDIRLNKISKQTLEAYNKLKVHCNVLGKGGSCHRTHKVMFGSEQISRYHSYSKLKKRYNKSF